MKIVRAVLLCAASCILSIALPAVAQNPDVPARQPNGLALTPPMGWNSWNKFACNVSEQLIRKAADEMVNSGMRDAGYQYVVIDDCWHGPRDADGRITADPQRFPSGIKALADYVHSKGLKFGIYSDAGSQTCEHRPGSQGHEYQDALQYAAWGVDYLKYDWCNTYTTNAQSAYTLMSDALRSTGRPILFSMCEWGTAKPWLWAQNVGNLWRTTGDIWDHYQGKKTYTYGMMDIVDLQVGLSIFSGPGHWNDPDMLEVGNGGMTTDEYRTHFSMWSELAAPLIAGNDLANMSADTREILTNKEVIAIDQDALGRQGDRVAKNGDAEVWSRSLADGGRAIVLLNRSEKPQRISVKWQQLALPLQLKLHVRDLWKHTDLPDATGTFEAEVAPHGIVMVRLGM